MTSKTLTVGLALLGLITILHAEIRPPGKYGGVAIFDRWDGCILCSGLYITHVSENLKESLRPFDGMPVVVDAGSVFQPVNPGDGLITGFNSPPSKVSRPGSTPIRLETSPDFVPGKRPAILIKVKNAGLSDVEIYSGQIGFTLLMKKPDRRPGFFPIFIPSDSPSFALIARQSFFGSDSPKSDGQGTTAGIRYSWSTDSRLPRKLTLAAGGERRIRIELNIPAGEYDFLVGHRDKNGQSIVSNRVAFDVTPNGAAQHIVIDRAKPQLVPQISHASRITDVRSSADGRWLVSASWDRSVHVRDSTSLQLHRVLRGDHMLTTVAITPDGHRVAAGGTSGLIRVWDRATGILRLTLGPEEDDAVSCPSVDFSPDGQLLATIVDHHKVQLWGIPSGLRRRQFGDPEEWYQQVRFSPDGRTLAASGRKGVRIWNVESGELVQTLLQKRPGTLRGPQSIAWSPDGSRLAEVTNRGVWNADRGLGAAELAEVNVWDPLDGNRVHNFSWPLGEQMGPVAWSSNGRYLALAGAHSAVWRTVDWEVVEMPARSSPAWGRAVESTCVSFLPTASLPTEDASSNDKPVDDVADAGARVVFGWEDSTLSMTSVEKKSKARTIAGRSWLSLLPQLLDGNRVASHGTAGQLIVWNLDEAKVSAIQNFGTSDWGDILAVSPDGQRVVGRSADPSHRCPIGLRQGDRLSPLTASSRIGSSSAAFSADGNRLFVCDGSNIVHWRFLDEQPQQVAMESSVSGRGLISLSDDGDRLVTCTHDWIREGQRVRRQPGGHVDLINTQDGEQLHRLVHEHVVNTVRLAPNGQLLATGDQKGTTRLWDCNTGEELRVLRTPEWHVVYPLAWSPDSRLLLTARGWQEYPTEPGLALWDTSDGRLVWSTRRILSRRAIFTKSGNTIVTEDADGGTLNCLSADDGELLVSMTTINTSGFQHPDWIMYAPDGHFTSSYRREKYVHWNVGRKVGPDAELSSRFNNAEVVASRIH